MTTLGLWVEILLTRPEQANYHLASFFPYFLGFDMRLLVRAPIVLSVLLSVALGVRLATAVWWESRLPAEQLFGFSDSAGYWALAQTIVRGEPYQYGNEDALVFRTPGYPLVLAGWWMLVGDNAPVLWTRILGALLGTLVVGEIYWLTRILLHRRAAYWAAAVATFYPGAVATSVLVLSEALFCPLLILQFILTVYTWRATRRSFQITGGLSVGVLSGLATLVRPSWLLFTPLVYLVLCVLPSVRRQTILIGGSVLLGLMCTMLPWWIRNYQVVGHFVPTTLQVGASLYDGWNPDATGASDMRFVTRYEHLLTQDSSKVSGNATGNREYQLDRRLRKDAWEWAKNHPQRVLQLAGAKCLRMWRWTPNADEFQNPLLHLAVATTYTPLLLLSLIGVVRFGRGSWPLACCWLPAIYFTLLHTIFVSSIRYREPAMLPLMVLAAGVLASIFPTWPRQTISQEAQQS